MRSMPGSKGAVRIQSPSVLLHDRSRPDFSLRFRVLAMTFDTKIAIVVREDLAAWQKLNVAAFLSGGLAGCYPEIVGERYSDASGRDYGALVRQPILIFAAAGEELTRSLSRARERGITP